LFTISDTIASKEEFVEVLKLKRENVLKKLRILEPIIKKSKPKKRHLLFGILYSNFSNEF
jgi:hypothetical protein